MSFVKQVVCLPPGPRERGHKSEWDDRGRGSLLSLRGDALHDRQHADRQAVHRSTRDGRAGDLSLQCALLFAQAGKVPERG